MSDTLAEILTPQALEKTFAEEEDVNGRINMLAKAIIQVLGEMGNWHDVSAVQNILYSFINQEIVFNRLNSIFKEIFGINKRLKALMKHENFSDDYKENFQKRASDIVNKQIFILQRDVFFKIVNAKEVMEGEKNEDGPALLFPAVERLKNEVLAAVQGHIQKLRPAAVDVCKTFKGISETYAAAEMGRVKKENRFDTIAQVYELEKNIRSDLHEELSIKSLADSSYLDQIINLFGDLKNAYTAKSKSLQAKNSVNVTDFDLKIKILREGEREANKRIKPLRILRSLSKRLPALEKQLDYFAESHYQAKAVLKFFEEVKEEMVNVFRKHNLESFTVTSLLKHKLNCTSHMYQAIYYYYALVQIEQDVRNAISEQMTEMESADTSWFLEKKLSKTGIPKFVDEMHNSIAKMNECNYNIHLNFLAYKEAGDLDKLQSALKIQTKLVNSLHQRVKVIYRDAQQVFFDFLNDDLGTTDFTTQFGNLLKEGKEKPEAQDIRKSFEALISTKKKQIQLLQMQFQKRFGQKLDEQKIAAMALLKVKMDFEKELLATIQKHPSAQDAFIEILKDFIKIQKQSEKENKSDQAIVLRVKEELGDDIESYIESEAKFIHRVFNKEVLSDRDIVVAFLAANISPHEIENFSRLIPALPRNEFQLDSSYGRLLLDVKSFHSKRLYQIASSGDFVIEKIFEKRERLKLVNKICEFLYHHSMPYIKRIDNEEKKLNSLIELEKRKYQKDLNQALLYWQYLVQDQIEPGQGQRGKFKDFKPDDIKAITRHIGPKQLDQIDRYLETAYDLKAETKLFEVETFLMKIASGLFAKFDSDFKIKAEFEDYEAEKRIKTRNQPLPKGTSLLESEQFVPNIKQRIEKVDHIKGNSRIQQILNYWEFIVDQLVPASDKRKKPRVPKVDFRPSAHDVSHYITQAQLEAISFNCQLILKIREPNKQKALIEAGTPLLNIAENSIRFFSNIEKIKKLKSADKERIHQLTVFCRSHEFLETIKSIRKAPEATDSKQPE